MYIILLVDLAFKTNIVKENCHLLDCWILSSYRIEFLYDIHSFDQGIFQVFIFDLELLCIFPLFTIIFIDLKFQKQPLSIHFSDFVLF